jgi:Domain of unknown function (DUF397)
MMIRDGKFRKAGDSGDHGCVEAAADETGVRVRDSKDQTGPVLGFTDHEWSVFVAAARAGEFDLPK